MKSLMSFRFLIVSFVFFFTFPTSKSDENFGWAGNGLWNDNSKDDGQSMVELYYLNGKQYLFFSQKVTWVEARMLCTNYNAKLAILDNMEKAMFAAEAIANSNIVLEDMWLGGRRTNFTWMWIYDRTSSKRNLQIPMEDDIRGYPPWVRKPDRPAKECLAIDRRAHSHPNFVDLDCRLQRSFICEKNPDDVLRKPVPSNWVSLNRYTYILYHARMTWQEAAFYCRSFGTRLAILDNPDTIEIISNSMTKARPDFENLWIGAHYSYGGWTWIATGVSLSDKTNTQGYPPWQNGYSEMKDGCLLLDRHLGNGSTFVETACDRKRDFICQKYPEDEEEEWLNEPVEFTYNQSTYIINPVEKTWEESREYCQETGSVLAYINDIHTTNVIIEAMGDHPKEISHVWMGGHFQDRSNEWQWIHSGKRIETKKDSTGFPPWVTINEQLDYQASASKCLNLDRTDHTKPHFYGLDCSSKQPFVCQINLSFDEEIVTDKQNVRHPEKLNETEKELTTTLKPTVTVPYISKETTRIPISIATTNITETATESYSPLQAETPSPLKIETSSHSRTETSSSSQTETFSPTQTEAFSPTQTETFSPTQPETFSPSQTKSYSPLLTETTNPSQTETSNPSQTETYSPSLTETSDLSQIETSNLSQTETSSPSQTETTNPSQTETSNPSQTETTNPSQTETTNPSQTETSNPSQTETSNPSQIETTNLSQTETSSPSQTETSGPSQTETYTPSQTETNVEGTTTQLPEQMAESATFIMPEIKIINETDLSVTEPFPTTLE